MTVQISVLVGSSLSSVVSSATNVTLLAANGNRAGVILVNDSTSTLFLKYGATATSSSYTYQIGAGVTWEMPAPIYSGKIDGIWSAANGNAVITEV